VTLVTRLLAAVLLVLVLGTGEELDRSLRGRAMPFVRDELYDFVAWEVDALWGKLTQDLLGVQPYLDPETGETVFKNYLTTLAQVQSLDAQIDQIYADPAITDPASASAPLVERRDDLRAQLEADQPLAEAILEDQVSAVLAEEGFGLWGQVLPPVSMHMTALPTLLIVSPRDRIEMAVQIELNPIPVERRAQIESDIDAALDVSSIIEPLGGLSLYPSMIVETSSLAQAVEITAHEWSHLYLMAGPLGLEYAAAPETRIINETVATYFGRAIALRVLPRYYPGQPLPVYPSYLNPVETVPDEVTGFDYYATMNETRVHVDALLADGKVDEAEAYMEAQRQVFVAHGYAIRKLNQAYFAFHGGYQGGPGAGGTDPIGPAVEELLALSPDLHTWLDTMRDITTRGELLAALDEARAAAGITVSPTPTPTALPAAAPH
jgi:hypothetical protein